MTRKQAVNGVRTHRGSWERFVTFNILGVAAICLNWIALTSGAVDASFFAGLLIGLFCGQVAICVAELARANPERRRILRPVYIGLTVVLFFLFIFVFSSARLAVGYFAGLNTTLCFGVALTALVRKP